MKAPQMSKNEIFQHLTSFQQNDLNTKGGKVWAYVYDSGLAELDTIAMEAYKMFANHNGLDFSVFPSLLKMENDIITETASLFSDGSESLAGTFTSGGTESIILAVKAARDYARAHKPSIKKPEIILPETAHAAFHKAAHYLDIKTVVVPVDEEFKVETEVVRNQINKNTIMLVGSAVNYSHGVSDPIEVLSEIALKYDLWLHVDGCIGGFLMAYFRELGHEVPKFDFSLLGVSSLSVDLHKYAFTPKGASVILYRNKDLRRYQFYTCTNWTGYPVINTTIQSTKSGGPLAACWATMHYIGKQGYKEIFEKMYQTKNKMLQKFEEMDDIYVLGKPEASLISFASKTIDIFQLADAMRKKGWYIQVQPGNEKLEPTIHLTLTPVSENIADKFFEQLKVAISEVKENPRISLFNKIQPFLTGLKEGGVSVNSETIQSLLQIVGMSKAGILPDEMADINELLHLLPSKISSEAFLYITNELFTIETT